MRVWLWLYLGPWLIFAVWWLVRAASTARTASTESLASRLSHAIFLGGGTLLLLVGIGHRLGPLSQRLWPPSRSLAILGVVLTVVGVAFAIWARETLGRLWSGTITLKEGHRVITSGPYALARHPIYTGIMVAFIGSFLGRRDWGALIGLLLVAIGIGRKIVIEEKLLRENLGDEYLAYQKRVKRIIPFIY